MRSWIILAVLCVLVLPAVADDFDAMREPIGPLTHAMTEARVTKAAGAPKKKGKPYHAGEATGDWQKDWSYDGVTVTLAADKKTGPKWTVRSITVAKGSDWKTKRGIAVGAARADVEKAYAKDKDTSDEESFIAGSTYGGIVFAFEADKVKSIFVGAASF